MRASSDFIVAEASWMSARACKRAAVRNRRAKTVVEGEAHPSLFKPNLAGPNSARHDTLGEAGSLLAAEDSKISGTDTQRMQMSSLCPVNHCDRVLGRESALGDRSQRFESAQNAENAIVPPA